MIRLSELGLSDQFTKQVKNHVTTLINSGMTPEELQQWVEVTLNEGELDKFFTPPRRKRKSRQKKNGAYVTCKWLADKTGYHPDTIRKLFLREKTGVDKRTFSGRNRKVYTVLRISKIAAKRRFPDLDI